MRNMMLVPLVSLFSLIFSPTFAISDSINLGFEPAKARGESAVEVLSLQRRKVVPVPDDFQVPDGIINPDYTPECDYVEGEYDCKDFSESYCDQFPTGEEDCYIIHFCGFEGAAPCHAANVTRIYLGDGRYLYCMVEPQANKVIPGTCWEGGSSPGRFPTHLHSPICRTYQLSCEETDDGPRIPNEPVRPRIYPDVPWSGLSFSF